MKHLLASKLWHLYLILYRYEVFLAYRNKDPDNQFAEWVHRGLSKRDFDVFRDNLLSGGDWSERIDMEIEKRPGAVVIESPASKRSTVVGHEVNKMIYHRRLIVPVLFRGKKIRPVLRDYQHIDCRMIEFEAGKAPVEDTKINELARCLRGESARPLDQDPPAWPRFSRQASLRLVAFIAITGLLFPFLLIKACATLGKDRLARAEIEQIRSEVRSLEFRISGLTAVPLREGNDGEWQYKEYEGSAPIITDTRRSGRLVRREFWSNDILIARDEFLYDVNIILGKERYYLNPYGELIAVERFAQDGLLTQLEYFPEMLSDRGRSLEADVTRSPLPPPALTFYR